MIWDYIKVQEKKKKVVVCFRSRQNVKLGTFTLYVRALVQRTAKKYTKKRDARAKLLFC